MKLRPSVEAAAVLFHLIMVTSCASTPPSSFYTLTPLPTAADRAGALTDRGRSVAIGPIDFPDFLDRPQIVSRAGANLLDVDELHRWAGSLQADFLRVLGENLAHLLGTSLVFAVPPGVQFSTDFRVIADVVRFEGTDDRTAVLKVRWAILDAFSEQPLMVRESSYRQRIEGVGQEALVAALSDVIGAFSRELAGTLQRRPTPKPSTVRTAAHCEECTG